jgi:hypothetical protein
MEPTLFTAINLLIDFVLILALSYYVPKHTPKLFILLVALNLSQYFIHIPINELPSMEDNPRRQHNIMQALEVMRATRENIELGGAGSGLSIKAPAFRLPNVKAMIDPRGQINLHIQAETADPSKNKPQKPEPTFSGQWLGSLFTDPHALWLFVRIFWLAAAFVLLMQRPSLGAGVAAFQLIPVPFISFALPYTYFWMQEVPWVASIQSALKDPENASSYISPEGLGVTAAVFSGILLILACLGLMVLAKRTSSQFRLEQKYLNPERYMIRINGNLLPFAVDGHHLVVEGIRLNCREVAVFPGRPHVWQLNSSTVLEFVEKE